MATILLNSFHNKITGFTIGKLFLNLVIKQTTLFRTICSGCAHIETSSMCDSKSKVVVEEEKEKNS